MSRLHLGVPDAAGGDDDEVSGELLGEREENGGRGPVAQDGLRFNASAPYWISSRTVQQARSSFVRVSIAASFWVIRPDVEKPHRVSCDQSSTDRPCESASEGGRLHRLL